MPSPLSFVRKRDNSFVQVIVLLSSLNKLYLLKSFFQKVKKRLTNSQIHQEVEYDSRQMDGCFVGTVSGIQSFSGIP
jgi:hypothetical protein